ncbi:hypothetical protein CFE70_007122 [Pyrenophora teres f. teres 0-1]
MTCRKKFEVIAVFAVGALDIDSVHSKIATANDPSPHDRQSTNDNAEVEYHEGPGGEQVTAAKGRRFA